MTRRRILLVLMTAVLFATGASAQKKTRTVNLYGHVKNSFTKVGIPDTKITLMTEDSTVVDTFRVTTYGGRTYKVGTQFKRKIPAVPRKYIILAQHPEYHDCYVDFEIKHVARNTYFDAPHHLMVRKNRMNDLNQMLDQVEVKATKVKLTYKGDTIVFNADAFNVPEGSMLDGLIRQLPGVELKDNGEILVNGRKVDYLTLNGKDFFKGKNKVMLDNLPYYTVKDINVYEKRTDLSEYLGRDTEQKEYVMDVQLKKEYSEGYLANAEVGGGTDDRFMGRLFGLRYTDNSRLALFVNRNNVNETRSPGSQGDWSPDKQQQGDIKALTAGMNLNIDDKEKRWNEAMNIYFASADIDSRNRSARESFIEGGNSFSRAMSATQAKNKQVSAYNQFLLRKPFMLTSTLNAYYSDRKNDASIRSASFNADPSQWGTTMDVLDSMFAPVIHPDIESIAVNRNRNASKLNSQNWNFETNNRLTKKFAWGDDISVRLGGSYNTQKFRQYDHSRYDYMSNATAADYRNRYTRVPTKQYTYEAKVEYTLHWLSRWNLAVNYGYSQNYNGNGNYMYRLDRLDGWTSDGLHEIGILPSTRDSMLLALDAQNTYSYTQLERNHFVGIRPHFDREGDGKYIYFNWDTWLTWKDRSMDYHSKVVDNRVERNYALLSSDLNFQYQTHQGDRLFSLSMSTRRNAPSMTDLMDVTYDSDPLAIRKGNPDLKPTGRHRAEMAYRLRNRKTDQTWLFSLSGEVTDNEWAMGYSYNRNTGAYTYRPENVDGNWYGNAYVNFSRAIGKEKLWRVSSTSQVTYSHSVDLERTQGSDASRKSIVNTVQVGQQASLTYQKDKLSAGVNGRIDWRNSQSERANFQTINATDFNYGLTCQYELPWKLQLATDLKMFSRRGYSEASMNTDDFVWNASLSRSFLKGKLTARLEGFDILGQLSNTSFSVNAFGRTEQWRNALSRYAMLHLIYKFSVMPKR